MLRRINYFRAMAGDPVSTLLLSDTYSLKAQAAALMMSANRPAQPQPTLNLDLLHV